jgi:hypothetical protein
MEPQTVDCRDLDDLVKRVFGSTPLPPHSIQLEITNATDIHAVFKTLGQLLTHGLVYMYGENVNLQDIDVAKVQQYLASVGWKAVLNPVDPKQYPRALPYQLVISGIRVIFEPI